jgi:hypothetical protein
MAVRVWVRGRTRRKWALVDGNRRWRKTFQKPFRFDLSVVLLFRLTPRCLERVSASRTQLRPFLVAVATTTLGESCFLFLAAFLFADDMERLKGEGRSHRGQLQQAPALRRVLDELADHQRRERARRIDEMPSDAKRSVLPVKYRTAERSLRFVESFAFVLLLSIILGRRIVLPLGTLPPGTAVVGHKEVAAWGGVGRNVGWHNSVDKVKLSGRTFLKAFFLAKKPKRLDAFEVSFLTAQALDNQKQICERASNIEQNDSKYARRWFFQGELPTPRLRQRTERAAAGHG